MCKIVSIIGLTAKKGQLLQFSKIMRSIMTTSDNDGFGYVATDGASMFSERWLEVDKAFNSRERLSERQAKLFEKYKLLTTFSPKYASTGNVDQTLNSVKTILLHARKSTNQKVIENTHPFVKEEVGLIHNGVISNHDKFKKTIGTCDSEAILTSYLDNVVPYDFVSIDKVFSDVTGSMAVGVLNQNGGEPFVDMFRNYGANLSVGIVEELGDALVFATVPEMVQAVCKHLKWRRPIFTEFASRKAARLNALTGDVVSVRDVAYSGGYNNGYGYDRGYSGRDYDNEEWDMVSNTWVPKGTVAAREKREENAKTVTTPLDIQTDKEFERFMERKEREELEAKEKREDAAKLKQQEVSEQTNPTQQQIDEAMKEIAEEKAKGAIRPLTCLHACDDFTPHDLKQLYKKSGLT